MSLDMSPATIDRRLRQLAELWSFANRVKGARWLGPVKKEGPRVGAADRAGDELPENHPVPADRASSATANKEP